MAMKIRFFSVLKNKFSLSAAATILFLPYFFVQSGISGISTAGISDTLDAVTRGLNEMKVYFQEIQYIISEVSFLINKVLSLIDIIGLPTILLFMAVLSISFSFSIMGIPKGKSTFLFSLASADVIWILWEKSFGKPAADFMSEILRANFTLLLPLIAVGLAGFIRPHAVKLYYYIKNLIKEIIYKYNLIPAKKISPVKKSMVLDITEKIQSEWTAFQAQMKKDLIASSMNDEILISPENTEKIKSIQEKLNLFKNL